MSRFLSLAILSFLTLTLHATVVGADRRQPLMHQMDSVRIPYRGEIRISSTRDTTGLCHIAPVDRMVWRVDGWVTGNELYKNYLDPSLSCQDPYPFSITEINMPMYFASPTAMVVSVDIEDVYYSTPECPWPDTVLAISSDYELSIAAEGLYDIWIPLDEPVVVNGPFFAGFFIGNTIDTSAGAAVMTGSRSSVSCRSYNIWDEQIGFVDLTNNALWNFPGQLILNAAGIAGGGEKPVEPEPQVLILSPTDGEQVFRQTTLWAAEYSGSRIIDFVSFEYSSGQGFVEIGRDYEGSCPRRGSIDNFANGDGYSRLWDFSSLDEGICTLRVTAHDTLGRSAFDETTVYLEPTPPTPRIIAPASSSDFCDGTDFLISCGDENLERINVYYQPAARLYSAGVQPLRQFDYGDGNGNSLDGNLADNGEYGSYYGGPVAAAMAINLWKARGYTAAPGTDRASSENLVEQLAALFFTRDNSGTSDDCLYRGLRRYCAEIDTALFIECHRRPDYTTIRRLLEAEGKALLLGLGGYPGRWLTVDGFSGWKQADGSFTTTAANPLKGEIEAYSLRDTNRGSELNTASGWQPVDLVIAISAFNWTDTRTLIGFDATEPDGWTFTWEPDELTAGSYHFITAEGVDKTGIRHHQTVILNHDCSRFYVEGDYDGDGTAGMADLVYLVEYIVRNGPPPVGGAERGDANDDTRLNVTDLVYYINYLYGLAGPPAH